MFLHKGWTRENISLVFNSYCSFLATFPVGHFALVICDATCQNQALLAKIGCRDIILLNKSVSLAFI